MPVKAMRGSTDIWMRELLEQYRVAIFDLHAFGSSMITVEGNDLYRVKFKALPHNLWR
jgi:hypothetical protein